MARYKIFVRLTTPLSKVFEAPSEEAARKLAAKDVWSDWDKDTEDYGSIKIYRVKELQ